MNKSHPCFKKWRDRERRKMGIVGDPENASTCSPSKLIFHRFRRASSSGVWRLAGRWPTGINSLIYWSADCLGEGSPEARFVILAASCRSYSRDMAARSSICSYALGSGLSGNTTGRRRDEDQHTRVSGTPTTRYPSRPFWLSRLGPFVTKEIKLLRSTAFITW